MFAGFSFGVYGPLGPPGGIHIGPPTTRGGFAEERCEERCDEGCEERCEERSEERCEERSEERCDEHSEEHWRHTSADLDWRTGECIQEAKGIIDPSSSPGIHMEPYGFLDNPTHGHLHGSTW